MLLLLLPALHMQAQNPFGFYSDYYTYLNVYSMLQKNENFNVITCIEDSLIETTQGEMSGSYAFNDSILYKIYLHREYKNMKNAEKGYKECMDYFVSTGAVVVDLYEDEEEKRVTGVRYGKVYRLVLRKHELSVSMEHKWVNYAPKNTLDKIDRTELYDDEE